MTWHVAGPSQYLVITGLFVKDVKISRKAWVLVGQKCSRIDITPVNYFLHVSAMSLEKLPFTLPAIYTIGPDDDDNDALCKYAKLVAAHQSLTPHVNKTVEGIIEGQTRVLAAGMPMEEIFKGSDEFQRLVKEGVERELQKLGLRVYNANAMQLKDAEGHEYFLHLGKKAQKQAENQAKVDVAEAQSKGDTGVKDREARALRKIAKVDAEIEKYRAVQEAGTEQRKAEVAAQTRLVVNEKKEEMGKADNKLAKQQAEWKKEADIANIEARKAAQIRKMEMQAEVERRKVETEIAKKRAEVVVSATISKEASQEEARSTLFKREKEADAALYARLREAEAIQESSQADAFAAKRAAEARLFSKVQEAGALRARAAAIAYSVRVLSLAVFQVFVIVLLSSWLARVVVPAADSGSAEVALRLPSFFINNAIFGHYFLPTAMSPPNLSLASADDDSMPPMLNTTASQDHQPHVHE